MAASAVQSNTIHVFWSPSAGATGYNVSRDNSPLLSLGATSFDDAGLAPASRHCYVIVATNSAGNSLPSASVCATTTAPALTNFPPFVMDGVVDFAGYLVASNTLPLYAALRGTKLYIATASPGTAGPNDYFIFVSDQLLASAIAPVPWAKSGKIAVATTKPFLAAESQNTYVAWYNAPTGSVAFKATSTAGQLEGVLDLVSAFGSMPTNIYLCAAAFATPDGGALATQTPSGSGSDIDPGEFFVIPTVALRDFNADGKFDRLDPALDFTVQSVVNSPAGAAVSWAAMPGHAYQLIYRDSLTGSWTSLVTSRTNASPLETSLSFTDPITTNQQRFYKVQLLP
jgi:hypothetical protein